MFLQLEWEASWEVSFGRVIYAFSKTEPNLTWGTAVGKPLRTWFHQSKIIQANER